MMSQVIPIGGWVNLSGGGGGRYQKGSLQILDLQGLASLLSTVTCREEEPKDLRTCWQKFVVLILQNIRTSLAKKNQQVLICGVRLHYHKHFDQKSGFNKGNLYYSTENIM